MLDSKVNATEPVNATHSMATEKKLWEPQRLLQNRRGFSSTCKKNAEANTKAYAQPESMQALDA